MTKDFVNHRFMTTQHIRPTRGELSILRVLWEHGPKTVREIQQVLDEKKPTGYTTVLKLLQIMTEKRLVERDENIRPQVYKPRFTQSQTQRRLLSDLIEGAFGGSVKALVLQALATKKTSTQEIEAIEKLLDRFDGGTK